MARLGNGETYRIVQPFYRPIHHPMLLVKQYMLMVVCIWLDKEKK